MSKDNDYPSDSANLSPLFVRSVVNSFGMGMVNPFIGAYVVQLGASSSEMGWFQSSANMSNNVLQVFWGKLSDRLGRRVPFIVTGNLIIMALWIPMIFVANATQLIVLVVIQALLGSMATPTWVALIGDLVPSTRLGRVNASISLWASLGTLVATLVSGFVMISVGGSYQQMFFVPFIVAILCGLASALVMIPLKERGKRRFDPSNIQREEPSSVFVHVRKAPDFMKYSFASAVFNFFMAIAWPLFSITLIRILEASLWEIALLSAVQLAVTIIFQMQMGKLADNRGRKPLLVAFRFSLVTVPLGYAFAPNVYFLIALEAFWGVSLAVGQASMVAYMLDVIPEEHRGSFAAFHNLLIGVASFFGSLLGGYLADYTVGLFGLVLGLQIVYL
ncbi:MAG: MFS transporter, partial [Candidatus Bathyarchaeota archaeon]|nr:MFS transporter [Candidatus Bathyarchaeota archaeon]